MERRHRCSRPRRVPGGEEEERAGRPVHARHDRKVSQRRKVRAALRLRDPYARHPREGVHLHRGSSGNPR
eukprot:4919-Pelagococcus_subviridis.AAC.1